MLIEKHLKILGMLWALVGGRFLWCCQPSGFSVHAARFDPCSGLHPVLPQALFFPVAGYEWKSWREGSNGFTVCSLWGTAPDGMMWGRGSVWLLGLLFLLLWMPGDRARREPDRDGVSARALACSTADTHNLRVLFVWMTKPTPAGHCLSFGHRPSGEGRLSGLPCTDHPSSASCLAVTWPTAQMGCWPQAPMGLSTAAPGWRPRCPTLGRTMRRMMTSMRMTRTTDVLPTSNSASGKRLGKETFFLMWVFCSFWPTPKKILVSYWI